MLNFILYDLKLTPKKNLVYKSKYIKEHTYNYFNYVVSNKEPKYVLCEFLTHICTVTFLGILYFILIFSGTFNYTSVSSYQIKEKAYCRFLSQHDYVKDCSDENMLSRIFKKILLRKKEHHEKFEDEQEDGRFLFSNFSIKDKWSKNKRISSIGDDIKSEFWSKENLMYNIKLLKNEKIEVNDYDTSDDDCDDNKISKYPKIWKERDNSKPIFNWHLGKISVLKMLDNAENFSIGGVKYKDWDLIPILPPNNNKNDKKVHKMFKASISARYGLKNRTMKFFIKKIPMDIWVKQYNLMTEYDGEYLLAGENAVMEAMALAFLNEYHPNIAPKFYKLLYEEDNKNCTDCILDNENFYDLNLFNDFLCEKLNTNINGNIVMISEYYGEDIFDFILRETEGFNTFLNKNKKKRILYESLHLLVKLHDAGFSHLDLSPENILITDKYQMLFCDFAKSTPLYSFKLRHLKHFEGLYSFESCEPSIGKIEYMPPECWNLLRKYKKMKIKDPMRNLNFITDQDKRKDFYYDVSNADKYMLGVFFIWVWNNGYLWSRSDPEQDHVFYELSQADMNFNMLERTKKWPDDFKFILKKLLHMEHRRNLDLKDLCKHPWFT
ncbi:serine/threonine protein kinase, FIKK family, partial [Plasmodium reichenowi]